MYYGSNSAFKRSQTGRSLSYSSNVLTIKGFMEGNTYHAVLNISVTPRRSVFMDSRRWLKVNLNPEE